jgi:ribose/xylose/arabinose/galactoside ABC-type transport system permease subunit/ABC-type branched-subunit amino acid transport system ATPase component
MHENGSGGGPERDGPLLRARGIDKSFGAVQALKGVDFEVRPGEVVSLIGDNGAGKSTLINVITGVFPPDSGEIVFEGERVEFASPHDARERGIEAVYQDLAVAPQLDAVANIFLGRERRMRGLLSWFGFLDQQRMRKETEEQLEELRVRIPDLTKRLSTFSGGQRQGVAVARAVMWASKVVIMDEPTAALGVAQAGMVLDLVRRDPGGVHQPQHAAGLRRRRPSGRLAAGRGGRGARPRESLDGRSGGCHDRIFARRGGCVGMADTKTRQEESGAGRRRAIPGLSSAFIFVILAGLVIAFSIMEGTAFLSAENFLTIGEDASELLLLAVGETFVIITAGIDLSVGSILVLSSVIAAQTMVALSGTPEQVRSYHFPNQEVGIPVGIAVGLLVGLACGFINGLLVTKLKLTPFIATLGTLGIFLGTAQILSGGTNVPYVPTAIQTEIGTRNLLGFLPVPIAIGLVVVILAILALHLTQFGRYTYAIGSNVEAARRVGIDVDRHLLTVYALSGFLAGLAGVIDLARFNTASVGAHTLDNLAAISAVVIGGTSLFGGIGTIVGSLVGTFIPAVLRNGFVIAGVQAFWQEVAIGMVLLLAVYIDQRRRSAEERA